MQVRMNKEIRSYSESVFFGLSLRQTIFSTLAVGVAAGIYFGLKGILGAETVSWLCILGAFPFAAMGFISYHGMTAERLLFTWIKSELIEPKRLIFKGTNLYYEMQKSHIESSRRREYKNHD